MCVCLCLCAFVRACVRAYVHACVCVCVCVHACVSLRVCTTVMTLQECIDQYHDIIESHEYSRLWIDLITSSCLVITADKVSDPPQPSKDYTWLNFLRCMCLNYVMQ